MFVVHRLRIYTYFNHELSYYQSWYTHNHYKYKICNSPQFQPNVLNKFFVKRLSINHNKRLNYKYVVIDENSQFSLKIRTFHHPLYNNCFSTPVAFGPRTNKLRTMVRRNINKISIRRIHSTKKSQ